jgi:putative DNA methylase
MFVFAAVRFGKGMEVVDEGDLNASNLGPLDKKAIHAEFHKVEATVGRRIRDLYSTVDSSGTPCEVLYYFWVKQIDCLLCNRPVDLLPSHIIGRNAFPHRKPEARIRCPKCGDIFTGTIHDVETTCPGCGSPFNPHAGNAKGTKATCSACKGEFVILDAVRRYAGPPRHRLIGKLVLKPNGDKRYLPATDADHKAYASCRQLLAEELQQGKIVLPSLGLEEGHNTRQALNNGYRLWRDFFNDRQLLALAWLQQAIAGIDEPSTRDAFLTLFSSTFEFNNVFASYKGEGTGAVRHMFSHHILKPERMPIVAEP